MTPKKVIIEITSALVKTMVLGEDDQVLETYEWERIGAGSWSGEKGDWYAKLNNQSEDESDFDDLAEALEDVSVTDIGIALGNINFEEFE